MAAIFQLPWAGVVIDAGDTLNFYDAETTTPQAVYSDADLMTAISQPISADSAGVFSVIYTATGSYKVVLKTSGGVTRYTADNIDSGIPAGSGALAVENGGTAATTPTAARTSLAAASDSDLTALAARMSAIEALIGGVAGGTLGDLAGLDTVSRNELASGFGYIVLQDALVASTTSVVTCTTAMPADNTVPQISEGDQVLAGSFTPISASSKLIINVSLGVARSAAALVGIAIFTDSNADAIAARWSGDIGAFDGAGDLPNISFEHRMDSPGTSSITFKVRVGPTTGTAYVNGNSSGTRIGGGTQIASLSIREILSF